jgi:osmoprotectant transport system ATP-binding protein
VRDFVGGADAIMKLLEFRTVGSLLRSGGDCVGDPVVASETLRSALTKMIASGRTALPVTDEHGVRLGAIHVDDIVTVGKQ